MPRLAAVLLCLFPTILRAQESPADFNSTSVEAREQSWRRHEELRVESPFYGLRWKQIGPVLQGGRIECFTTKPDSPSTMYAGVGSGGLWKSINNGLTWTPIFEQQSSIAIGDVAISPARPSTIWVGSGEVLLARSALPGMGVFRSDDEGRTWRNVGLKDTQHIARVKVHPTNPDIVYVAAIGHQNSSNEERGVFRTMDGGESWERVLYVDDHTSAIDLAMDADNPNVLYASMWERDVDGQKHQGAASGLYKSVDGGDSWNCLEGGLPTGTEIGRIAVAIASSAPDTVYALVDEGSVDGFYRSTDGGQTWSRTYDKLQARWDWCEIQVAPDDAQEVYSIGQNSFVSNNGGETFSKIGGDIVHLLPHGATVIHLDTHAMWINPTNSNHVIFGTDGGLFVSHDRCRTWLHLNNMPIAECYAVTYDDHEPFNVYIGTQDNAALFGPSDKRPAVGLADPWQHVYLDRWGGGDSYFTYRDPADEDFVYYEHQLGAMRRKNMTTGETQNIQPRIRGEALRFAWMTPFFPSNFEAKTLYCGANRVFKSTDQGSTWTAISKDLVSEVVVPNIRYRAITSLAESPIARGTLFAATDNGDLHVTKDDGATWTDISNGLPKRAFTRVHASPHDSKRVFVTQSGAGLDDYGSYVFRSDDGGTTWSSISLGLPKEPVNVISEDPIVPDLLYVGTDMGVYASLDGGNNWNSLCANLPTTSVYDLFVHPREHQLVIGTHGRSVFTLDVQSIHDQATQVVTIGNRRELFVDDTLIAKLEGSATLELQLPEPKEVVLTLNEPWEGNTSAYFTMFQDGKSYRAWYRGSHYDEVAKKATHPEVVCYAESKDGLNWTKPDLGLLSYENSSRNNIVWDDVGSHCFAPFKDTNPNCRPEAKYKAVSRGRPQRAKGLYAFQSPDGIHWSLMDEKPVITEGAFDSQNLAFWDPATECYRCYHRNFRNGVRDIMVQTSDDFVHWSAPEYLRFPDSPREHLYTNAIQPYFRAPHIKIGFPTRYLPNQGQRVEPTFMSSRDGRTFKRWSEPIIPESAPRDRSGNRSNYMVHGLLQLPTASDQTPELSVFGTEAYYEGPDNRVRRFAYRVDGFVALTADEKGGRLISKPFVFDGKTLQINFRTRAKGSVRVHLHAKEVPETRIVSERMSGDSIHHTVEFTGGRVGDFSGDAVVMTIELENAELYSFKFD